MEKRFYTIEEFFAKYEWAREIYGEGWEDIIIESLLRENIQIIFLD